jgi:23S rRNA pseudouridine1911/1915/1917 synthase
VVPDGTRPARIDGYLHGHGIAPSRAQAQRLLAEMLVTVNDQPVKPSYKVRPGDRIDAAVPEPTPLDIQPANLPLEVLYEDDAIAVVNKPAGMVVHPAPGNWEGTLVHALLHHLTGLSGIGGRERPGIVHRIDKETSGLLVVAKTDHAHQQLSARFKAHAQERRYLAIVAGVPKPAHGTIDLPIGRDRNDRKRISPRSNTPRRAITHYRVLETFDGAAALVECKLETGRTHQIRVHLAERGHPVLGDPVYGGKRPVPTGVPVRRQMLHATRLDVEHPESGQVMRFDAPPPDDFERALAALREIA